MSDLHWWLCRRFWVAVQEFIFRKARPLDVPVPSDAGTPVGAVPFARQYPSVPIDGPVVAGHAPPDEFRRSVLFAKRIQLWLYRVLSPMQPGLPEVDADPFRALQRAFPRAYRTRYRAPRRPPELDGPVDLGALAVASPYACYLEADGAGSLQWDLMALADVECQPGLRVPAARVGFTVDAAAGRLRATTIASELGTSSPGDADWDASVRLALCAATTHLSLIRHFSWVHLAAGGPLAIATSDHLPSSHPLRRLLQPHVYATHFGNRIVTIDQMEPGGDFENIFSVTHRGMCEAFESTFDDFDLRMIEPDLDVARRGIAGLPFAMPALENRQALMRVIRAHVERYLAVYFDGEDALRGDAAVEAWLEGLERMIPHGVRGITGSPITWSGLVTLIATFVYLATVEHEIVGSGLWDYQLWSDVQPVRVAADGLRPPLDVYQRLVGWNFSLNVERTALLTDFSALALDARGADAFRRFRDDLITLQQSMNATGRGESWRMEPRFLKANINY